MTSRSPSLSISSATPLILPIFTTLLGLTGLGSGTYAILRPFEAIGPFGLRPPPAASKSTSPSSHAKAFCESIITVYGLRNLSSAIGLLGMTYIWKFSPLYSNNALAAEAARRCIGFGMIIGTGVAAGDAYVIRSFADCEGVPKDAADEAKAASFGHAVISIPILAVGLTMFFL